MIAKIGVIEGKTYNDFVNLGTSLVKNVAALFFETNELV